MPEFLQDMLNTHPITPQMWAVAIGVSLTIVPAVELHKWWWNRRHPEELAAPRPGKSWVSRLSTEDRLAQSIHAFEETPQIFCSQIMKPGIGSGDGW